MAAGDRFSDAERARLDAAIRAAEQVCRAEFSIYVGSTQGEQPRRFATSLHNSLVAPSRSIVIMVDPDQRAVEVVTGGHVRRTLTDERAQEAVAAMTHRFADDELVEGLTAGIRELAEGARTL